MPAAASIAASSFEEAAAAAVAADISAFLASIFSSQSCSSVSAAAAAGEVSPFLEEESFGAGGRGDDSNSYLGAAGVAEAGARSRRPTCPRAGPPCFTVSSQFFLQEIQGQIEQSAVRSRPLNCCVVSV